MSHERLSFMILLQNFLQQVVRCTQLLIKSVVKASFAVISIQEVALRVTHLAGDVLAIVDHLRQLGDTCLTLVPDFLEGVQRHL
jgi:hypothetical protein